MDPPKLVAVAGPSGSRKTESCHRIKTQHHPSVIELISLDDFYKDQELFPKDTGWINWELPSCLDFGTLYRVLKTLKENRPAESPTLDHQSGKRGTRIVEPAPVVLAEGFLILHEPRIRRLFDLKIFLEVPESLQIRQRLEKDPTCDPEYVKRVVIPCFRLYGAAAGLHADWIFRGDQPAKAIARQIIHAIHETFGSQIDFKPHTPA